VVFRLPSVDVRRASEGELLREPRVVMVVRVEVGAVCLGLQSGRTMQLIVTFAFAGRATDVEWRSSW
jgi:hypothetical protein